MAPNAALLANAVHLLVCLGLFGAAKQHHRGQQQASVRAGGDGMLFYSHKTHCEHLGSFVCPSPPSHLDVDHRWVCIQQLAEVGPDVLLRDREDAGDTGEVRVLCNGWKDACAASFTHPPPPIRERVWGG